MSPGATAATITGGPPPDDSRPGQPKISGKIYAEHGNAKLGYSFGDPESGGSGDVAVGHKDRTLPNGWSEWSCSAGGNSPQGLGGCIEAVAVYLEPDKEILARKEGRTVVYVDDLEVEAALPQDFEKEIQARIDQIRSKAKAEIVKTVDALRTRFKALVERMNVPAELPMSIAPVLNECWRQRQEYSRQTRSELEKQFVQLQTAPNKSVLISAQRHLASLEKIQATAESFVEYAKTQSALPFVVWIVEPISNEKVLPEKLPLTDGPGTQLRVSACRGEYEPAVSPCMPQKSRVLAEPSA